MAVNNENNISQDNVPAGEGTTIQVLISPEEGPNFAMRKFTIQSGGGMPLHTNMVEHEQYVLKGQAKVQIGDVLHHVKQGDFLLIPNGVQHSYQNSAEGPFEFLCMIPNKPDKIELVLD
ncbi:cupin domain-containing protein [Chloroflexota bacterium]